MTKMTLRLSQELHDRLKGSSEVEHRSLHSEVIVRLERSFVDGSGPQAGAPLPSVGETPQPATVSEAERAGGDGLPDKRQTPAATPTTAPPSPPRRKGLDSVLKGGTARAVVGAAAVTRPERWSVMCPERLKHVAGQACPHCKGSGP